MNSKLFQLALEKLRPSDWEHFEELSSKFLASDFVDLRTMASPSGDGGRDSELFSSDGLPRIAAQYSVASDWNSKINNTIKRLQECHPNISILIYLTNQVIGAKSDAKKTQCLKQGITLDIRDRNWFLERYEADDSKYSAAETLVDIIARPYLESEEVISRKRAVLNSQEAKAALIYLGLQFEDENTEKGLTKIAFESLVKAALRNTNSNNRVSREKIYGRINSYVQSYPIDDAKKYVDSALSKLKKKVIRHWEKEDEFCLMLDETLRLNERLAKQECDESDFDMYIDDYLLSILSDYSELVHSDIPECRNKIKQIIDLYLIKMGENFALSVISGEVIQIDSSTLNNVIFNDVNERKLSNKKINDIFPQITIDTIRHILSSKSQSVIKHLRKLSDAYTLFAFLREVPDVQNATRKR